MTRPRDAKVGFVGGVLTPEESASGTGGNRRISWAEKPGPVLPTDPQHPATVAKFWRKVYVAAVHAGRAALAFEEADQAVEGYRERFPTAKGTP